MKTIQSFLKKFTYWVLIPLILIALWIFLSSLFNSFSPFSILVNNQGSSDVIKTDFKEIYADKKVQGEFKAADNYLGIVAVRFNTYFRINSDSVKFRIKEKGEDSWYYENVHKVDQFQPNDYFTFGLPVINASKGKTYNFEIESVKGTKGDAVAISKINPLFVTKYQYPKYLLLNNKKTFILFMMKKTLYFFTNPQLILSTLIFVMPLFAYLFWKLLLYRHIPFQYLLIFLFLAAFIAYIFYIPQTSITIIITLLMFWVVCVISYKFDATVSLTIALVFLILGLVFLILGAKLPAEKSISFTYSYMGIAVIESFCEMYILNKVKLVSIQDVATVVRKRLLGIK